MKLKLIATAVLALSFVSCGRSGYMRPAAGLTQPTPEKAIVRFMRTSGYGGGVNVTIWDGDQAVGVAVARCQFDYLADPGHHLFISVAENVAYLEADLEAGKTYYVNMQIYSGTWKARAKFIPILAGGKWWDHPPVWETKLKTLEVFPEKMAAWQAKYQPHAAKYVADYETLKAQGWPKLSPADGR